MRTSHLPSLGMIVQYGEPTYPRRARGLTTDEEPCVPEPWAAIVKKLNKDGSVNLQIFNPTLLSNQHVERVKYSETLAPYCWSLLPVWNDGR
jgi:hypothetical protein